MSESRSTTRRSASPWTVAVSSFAAGALVTVGAVFFFGGTDTASSDTTTTMTEPTATEPTLTSQPTSTTRPEESEATTPETDAGIPEAATEMVDQIRSAVEAEDLDTLAHLALEGAFTASFGREVTSPDELVALWEEVGREEVLVAIKGLIGLPNWYETESRDIDGDVVAIFVTPRFMHELSNAENRRLLEEALGTEYVETSVGDGQYLGWRLGVTADGDWQFFVSGD